MNSVAADADPPSRWSLPPGIAARLDARPLRYLLAGVWNTFFGVGASFLLYWMLHDRLHYLVIIVVANILAVTMAYATHRTFVYRTRGRILGEYLRFYVVHGAGLAFGLVATPLCMEVLGLGFYASQLLILLLTVALSYVAHGRFTFARDTGEAAGAD